MRWAAAAAVATLLASCERPRTELVVRVDSEIPWGPGQQVQSVTLTLRRGGPSGPLRSERTTVLGTGDGRRTLPLYVGVTPADDDTATPLWIEALGCGGPGGCSAVDAVVMQRAVVRFARDETLEVPLLLAAACRGAVCPGDERCAMDTGRCEVATRAQEMVRPFVGADAALDAATDLGGEADTGDDVPPPADASADASTDDVSDASPPDAAFDAPTDRPIDVGSDVLADVPADVPPVDVPPDVVPDDALNAAPRDVSGDVTSIDMPDAAAFDAPRDAVIDAPPDLPRTEDVRDAAIVDASLDVPRVADAAGPLTCTPANAAVVCGSRPCEDGYCCNRSCAGACRSCALPGSEGICTNYLAGTDPESECWTQASTTCGTTGLCNAAGACAHYPGGTPCDDGNPGTSGETCTAPGNCGGVCQLPIEACSNGVEGRDRCTEARVIGRRTAATTAGYVVSGDTCRAANRFDDCAWDAGSDHAYRLWLRAGETVTVSLAIGGGCATSTWDATLKLYQGTDCATVTCSGDRWCRDRVGTSPQTYAATRDGWVVLVVDGSTAFDDEGAYTLTVRLTGCAGASCECP